MAPLHFKKNKAFTDFTKVKEPWPQKV